MQLNKCAQLRPSARAYSSACICRRRVLRHSSCVLGKQSCLELIMLARHCHGVKKRLPPHRSGFPKDYSWHCIRRTAGGLHICIYTHTCMLVPTARRCVGHAHLQLSLQHHLLLNLAQLAGLLGGADVVAVLVLRLALAGPGAAALLGGSLRDTSGDELVVVRLVVVDLVKEAGILKAADGELVLDVLCSSSGTKSERATTSCAAGARTHVEHAHGSPPQTQCVAAAPAA